MAKSVSVSTEELRRDVVQMKQRVERLRAEGRDLSEIEPVERWLLEAEQILARWDNSNGG